MNALFISYNAALEPLIQSQGIPYLKGLTQRGANCTLLTFEKPAQDMGIYKERAKQLSAELRQYGIKWYRLRYHKRPTLPATLFDICTGTMAALYIILSRKIDLIHARSTVPAAMGYMAGKITGKKFLFDERGLMAQEYVDGGMWKKNGLLYKMTLYFEKKFLTGADAVVVLSENIKSFLTTTDYLWQNAGQHGRDITVIPCCVDTQRFTPDRQKSEKSRQARGLSGKFVFLYTGSLGTWYLLDKMLDFLRAAKAIIPDVHFLAIVRTGDDLLRRQWEYRGFSQQDLTITAADFPEMPDYIRMADVGMFFIQPTLSKRSSCPTKFAEYLSCGLPVLINDGIGDTGKLVRENNLGVVIDSFCEEAYRKAAARIFEIAAEKDPVSLRCRKFTEDFFSLQRGVNEYFRIYTGLNQVKQQ